MLNNQTIITASLVQESDRINALPHFFKNHMITIENMIYHFMKQFCRNYTGGYWDFYCLDNGGFYMSCQDQKAYNLSTPYNYFDANVDADTAGIIVCLYAYNFLCNKYEDENLIEQYYKLLDYANSHPSAKQIFQAIN